MLPQFPEGLERYDGDLNPLNQMIGTLLLPHLA